MNTSSEEKKALDQEQQKDNSPNTEQKAKENTKATADSAGSEQEAAAEQEKAGTDKAKATKSKKDTSSSKKTKKKDAENIRELEAKLEEQKDKFLRLYAEFENYRRRTSKEKLNLSQTANSGLITKLLPVLDDYERAQKAFSENEDLNTFKEGIELIADKFRKILKQEGLEVIESTNKEFNTDEHEAITKMPAPSEEMKGKVIDTTEKGYKLNDKVIRYAKVVVGN
jgi:molecular chaperone GrpE